METKAAEVMGEKETMVTCRSSSGMEIRGMLQRFTQHHAIFDIYAPSAVLRTSEVLSEFKIIVNDQLAYSGDAVVTNLVGRGEMLVCEVSLGDHWLHIQSPGRGTGPLRESFRDFLLRWQRNYKILPEFKVVVADMRSLLADMRLWLDQLELAIRSAPTGERMELEQETADGLSEPVLSAIDSLGDRFEEIASRLDPGLRPAHIHFTRRSLHSLLLCSPFAYRTFHKPLGYAGDYEMVNMILRSPYEGASLFAKLVNAWFLNQLPARAHRNRIVLLQEKLAREISRTLSAGRRAEIFNLGCGPASEIQQFLAGSHLAEHAAFTLLDFNEETIQHTTSVLTEVKKRHNLDTAIQMRKRSVQQLLKDAARPAAGDGAAKYDFVYCAGLFDYLPDRVCKQLTDVFYQWLAPGGLLLVTNVDGTLAFRNKLEFILDWNLIYRSGKQLLDLRPEAAGLEACSVQADWTSVNVFLEVRKPNG